MEKRISSQKITPNLWFDNQAEEAARFYTSVFHDSRIGRTTRYTKEGFEHHQKPEGSVMTIEFIIEGQEFIALNGGPIFTFNEAISLVINCETQEEVDYYWEKLTEGGDERAQVCGWLKDRFGISWQVVPTLLNDMILDPDSAKVNRVLQVMFQSKKLDIARLKSAYEATTS
ncbi:VOC family protein [Parapedobacter indicus]|uniref:Glyoxalase superfamily enzyme, possibly 3-demethylubiquinone-9 3-methyltransferase n=1 Tax=Parapedobacter indicus TaxID=1477437 RepID=A0A1I3KMJ3_9SPHI|nr:VOC family protein [Parapedobacter indicus]PPL01859.1 putative 3-demethylubiquinone-9 3-methyltransferase (glyoxalase superfamily) [Parapedobacter indicus]SFI73375.1 Glyoxalase superfamily enzyme, possibly 3-demethylubiquinone-9 3-methyltransferase [Parapedobacter indicus]